jgi:hypothetical protein
MAKEKITNKEDLPPAIQKIPIKSDEQLHYESLTRYFKYLVGITVSMISIILAFGTVMIIKDRTDYTQQVQSFKKEALLEIEKIKNNASSIAQTEAEKSVKEVYEKENMSELVKNIIKTDPAIKTFAAQEVQAIQNAIEHNLDDLTRVSAAIGSIEYDIRKGLDDLIDVSEHSNNKMIRNYANDILKRTVEDANYRYNDGLSKKNLEEFEKTLKEEYRIILNPGEKFIQGVLNYIETGDSFSGVFVCFAYLKKSGIDVKFFDFNSVAAYKRSMNW